MYAICRSGGEGHWKDVKTKKKKCKEIQAARHELIYTEKQQL